MDTTDCPSITKIMKSEITKKNEEEPIQGHVVAFEQDIEGF